MTVAYFTAVLARSGLSWKTRDVEVDDATTLEELTDVLRSAALDEQPVLAVIEHEDEWFALVRVDGDEEPRLFVSDLGATAQGHYADLLASAADVDVEDEDDLGDEGDDGDDEDEDEGDAEAEPVVAAWAGDPEILDDLGVSARALRKLTEERGDDPGSVLAEIGETVGFSELLDALR
jgi:putative tRNA adenosine deaminase-associated protein